MEGIERMNIIMVHPNQRAKFTQYNPYTIDMDRGNRNCYNYRGFGYLARNCRNRETGDRIGKKRRLEYRQRRIIEGGNKDISNLNGDKNLIVLDQVLVEIGLQYSQGQQIIHLAVT